MAIPKILACVLLISVGQVLLKWGMNGLGSLANAIHSPAVWVALSLYGMGMLLWLDVLRKTSLQLAYPFIALSFILVPFLNSWLVKEPLQQTTLIGGLIIIAGICISVWPLST